ncbi:MAG: alpha/beta hydrolase fold domain-containing protein [Flavobacteriales bacterium]|nr:alpha/beta hydrolase fold domain-containing protein [Flavobacteriales bacterium]
MIAQESPYCVPERFGNQYIYAEEDVVVQSDIEYGLSQTVDGIWEPQLMDIYTVDPVLDSLDKRPLVIVLHGGGFKTGDKTDYLVVESMLALARSGYTAATFNYRLGYDEPSGPCSADPDDIRRAAYRALQDCHAAMRFLFHHQDTYEIDTSFVFAGGVSAGGTLASLLHYGTPEYFNEFFPSLPLELGPLNTTGNDLDDEFHIDGLIMAWGSFPPFLDITSDNVIPIVTYHGANDSVVPIGNGTFNNCPDYPLTVGPDVYIPDVDAAGGACYDYNRSPDGEHNISMYGEFYIKNRTMCFMKSIMCNSCESSQQEEGDPTCPELGVGLSENDQENTRLRVVPNPIEGRTVCLEGQGITGPLTVEIYDSNGRSTDSPARIDLSSGNHCLEIEGLRSGIYHLKVISTDGDVQTLDFLIR